MMTKKTALIVVDLQNQYTDPNGRLYDSMTGETLPHILEGIRLLREQGVYIVYAMAEADGTEFSYDTEVLKRRDPVPVKGSWEAQADARLEIKENDRLMTRYASSAFFGTDLAQHLRERGILNVITCGVKTNYDVRATATDAMWYHFNAFVASDMVACDTKERNDRHLEELTKYTAKALPLEEILARIEAGSL